MAISVGNQLYIYRLLVQKIGVGQQVMLSRMEEVLLECDILPCDLGCADVRELLEQLSTFVRLTVFKKGRVYATVLPQPEWDAALEILEKEASAKGGSKGGQKSWKHKRSKKSLRPVRPRPKNRPVESEPEPEPEPAVEPEPAAEPEPEPATASEAQAASDKPESATGPKPEPVATTETSPSPTGELLADAAPQPSEPLEHPAGSAQEPKAEGEEGTTPKPSSPTAQQSAQEQVREQRVTTEPAPAANASFVAQAKPAETEGITAQSTLAQDAEPAFPVAPEPPTEPEPPAAVQPQSSITFTVTYDPYEGMEEDLLDEPPAQAQDLAALGCSPTSQVLAPHDFAQEVYVPNEQLSSLYRMLPLDVDPVQLLSEDWRVARSTHAYTRDKGIVSFSLRYLESLGGKPLEVRMQRTSAERHGKRWNLVHLDQVDEVGFEGLPESGDQTFRDLAQFCLLGPWDELEAKLLQCHGGLELPLSGDDLQTYLSYTLRRIQCEDKLVLDQDGERCLFDTGLLTSSAEPILMRMEKTRDDSVPWHLVDFVTPELAGASGGLAKPASYLSTLANIAITPQNTHVLDDKLESAYGKDIVREAQVAVRRAVRDYRLAVPAYDPIANNLRLLLPVQHDGTMALVLEPTKDGFVARSLVSPQHAAACARVVSFELPRWLEG